MDTQAIQADQTEFRGGAVLSPLAPLQQADMTLGEPGPLSSDTAAFEGLSIPSVVTHELRAPIQALTISAGLLVGEHTVASSPQARKLAGLIVRQSLWLQATVENLLCAAAIQRGRLGLRCQPLELRDVMASITPVVRPLLQQKEQTLRVRVDHDVPAVEGDRHRIGQILVNLLVNASKYSPRATRIDVFASVFGAGDQQWIRLTVADRGPGLPPEGAGALFAPFQRGTSTETMYEAGAGLGLAIVRAIVEAHGGHVGAEPRLGGGACFWFSLPATTQESDGRQAATPQRRTVRARRAAC